MSKVSLFWHRRDLRLHDNAGLYHALDSAHPVLPVFIFDREILDELEDEDDARVTFIHQEIERIREELQDQGSDLLVKYGHPEEVWKEILDKYDVAEVYTNRDYEPYAKERDEAIEQLLESRDIPFHTYKDHVILEAGEVLKGDGDPYVVFTPYSRTWRSVLEEEMLEAKVNGEKREIPKPLASFDTPSRFDKLWQGRLPETPALEDMGFKPSELEFPSRNVKQEIIRNYDKARNFPAQQGTSRLGLHFRFGTISIREKARRAYFLNATYLNELIWRDFYSQILAFFPKVVDTSFREKYDFIDWRNKEEEFQKWCEGKTGYPIVDAGMRELNTTGYMHNRVRMITASFLTKHLLIDWRWGEAYFARKLLDYELASNNGGWQWAAGSGTDAAPYFRIFNPESQQKKFDKDKAYIRKWVPEYGTDDYPEPMVDHKMARERCLETYKAGLAEAEGK